ncbi:TRI27 protein, partial [Urocolius indicus]|nr:TRI27 protein [Urocolius indicus]
EKVLQIARRLSLKVEEEEEEGKGGGRCQKHREPLKFFCRDEGTVICAICRESRWHRAHTVLPARDALQEHREQIQTQLQTLQETREQLLGLREVEMRRSW